MKTVVEILTVLIFGTIFTMICMYTPEDGTEAGAIFFRGFLHLVLGMSLVGCMNLIDKKEWKPIKIK